jgi:uncharacterized GH25 family protein
MVIAALLLMPSVVLAHFGWLSVPNHEARLDRSVKMFIGWGHKYPLDDFLETSAMGELKLYDPKGAATVIKPANDFAYETNPLKEKGVYLAVAEKKPGFYSRTAKGYTPKPKTGLKGVLSCTRSLAFMKAVINVGQGPGDVSRPVGQALELIPLKNPGDLKVGDYLPIKVMFKGKPVQGYPPVMATYCGFENPKAYAHTSGAGRDGVAMLRILHNGPWLVKVNVKEPYPDPKECDQTSYTSVLTFEIK